MSMRAVSYIYVPKDDFINKLSEVRDRLQAQVDAVNSNADSHKKAVSRWLNEAVISLVEGEGGLRCGIACGNPHNSTVSIQLTVDRESLVQVIGEYPTPKAYNETSMWSVDRRLKQIIAQLELAGMSDREEIRVNVREYEELVMN